MSSTSKPRVAQRQATKDRAIIKNMKRRPGTAATKPARQAKQRKR